MSEDKITKEMITNWVKHPVTQGMLTLTTEILESNKDMLNGLIVNGPSLGQQDLHVLSQLRGQILALQQVLNMKEFLSELVEEEANTNEI